MNLKRIVSTFFVTTLAISSIASTSVHGATTAPKPKTLNQAPKVVSIPSKAVPKVKPLVKTVVTPKQVPKTTKAPVKTSKVKVTLVSATLVQNNHVGNEWSSSAKINGQVIYVGRSKEMTLKNTDSIILEATATESDKYPDYGYNKKSIVVSSIASKIANPQVDVVVTENRGRYSGNTAKWKFVFKVEKK